MSSQQLPRLSCGGEYQAWASCSCVSIHLDHISPRALVPMFPSFPGFSVLCFTETLCRDALLLGVELLFLPF